MKPIPEENLIQYMVYTTPAKDTTEVVADIKSWYTTCGKFLRRNYCFIDEQRCSEVIRIPVDCKLDNFIGHVASVLEVWLENESKGGLVLSSYNSLKHCEFLGLKTKDLADKLLISADMTFDNRILVYHPTSNIILNIRILEEITLINEAMLECCGDVKLLFSAHTDLLFNSDVVVIALVALPDCSDDQQSIMACPACKDSHLLVLQSDLADAKTFNKWWRKKISKVIQNMRMEQVVSKSETRVNMFFSLSSRIVGFMATEKAFLPTLPSLSDNINTQLMTVMLNKSQQRVMNALDNKIIITGPFGSGKSVLGQLKLKRLIEQATEKPSIIFYLNADSRSVYQFSMQEYVKKLIDKNENKLVSFITETVAWVKEELKLSSDSGISDVFQKLLMKHSDKVVHIIVEEYDGENMSKTEAEIVQRVLKSNVNPFIKDSTIILINHSLEKHREFIKVGNAQEIERSVKHESYYFESTGMKIYDLSQTMRNTKIVNEMVKCCQTNATNNPMDFNHPEHYLNSTKIDDQHSLHINNPALSKVEDQSDEISNIIVEDTSSIRRSSPFPLPKDERHEIDLDSNMSGLTDENDGKTNTKTKTTYRYCGECLLGHNINGDKADLFCVDLHSTFENILEVSDEQRSLHYSICLESLIGNYIENSETVSLLCFNPQAADILCKMMHLLDEACVIYTPSFNESHTSMKKLEFMEKGNIHLISDFKGFRSMEAKNVIVLLTEEDRNLRHYLAECISRSTGTPKIIYLGNIDPETQKKGDLSRIFCEWETKKLVNRFDVVYCVSCTNGDDLLCKTRGGEVDTKYGLHINSAVFLKKCNDLSSHETEDVRTIDRKELLEFIDRYSIFVK